MRTICDRGGQERSVRGGGSGKGGEEVTRGRGRRVGKVIEGGRGGREEGREGE